MKKTLILLLLLTSNILKSQYCSSATSTTNITPTASTQTTTSFNSGRPCFVFNATAGCTYLFSTCGLSTIDTYLSLYTGTISVGQTYNDDACSLQSNISWSCPTSGVYSLLLTEWSVGGVCNNITGNVQLSYRSICPYSTTLTIPSSGSNTISCGTNTTLYDNGGTSNYTNNNDGYTVIKALPLNTININGIYDVENSWWDFITIYSGVGTGGTLLATYTGVGNINYTGAAGQTLTIRFKTDGSITYSGFQLNITYSGLCSALPIELISFDGYKYDEYNLLTWVSATELNNDYYRLEKSTDALSWETAYIADGSGTSYTPIHYQYKDYNYKTSEIIYYRLIQVDLNGNSEIFNIVSIDRTHNKSERKLVKVTNILGQEVDPETNGVLIYQYSDGSYDKNYKIK